MEQPPSINRPFQDDPTDRYVEINEQTDNEAGPGTETSDEDNFSGASGPGVFIVVGHPCKP